MRTIPLPHRFGAAPRVLLIRLDSLRGIVHAMPVLCAVRRHFPAAHVAWLVEERAAAILAGHAALDRVIRVDRGWLRSPGRLWRLRRDLAREQPDIVIDLQEEASTSLAARLSGARCRIGFDGRGPRRLLHTELVSVRAGHVIEHNLAILRPLGIFDPPVEYALSVWAKVGAAADRFLRRAGLLPGGFALMDAAAEAPHQAWLAERYGCVARYLGEHCGLSTVAVWTSSKDRGAAEELVAASGGWGHLAPPTSPQGLAELARRAALFVGSDTGHAHVAVAAGAPTITLHGTTQASWSGAYGPNNISLQAFYDSGRSHRTSKAPGRAVQAISVDTVCAACARALQAKPAAVAGRVAA